VVLVLQPPLCGTHSHLAFATLPLPIPSVAFLKLTASSRLLAPPSGSPKCLSFGLWLTLCTLNIYLFTYLLTYLVINGVCVCVMYRVETLMKRLSLKLLQKVHSSLIFHSNELVLATSQEHAGIGWVMPAVQDFCSTRCLVFTFSPFWWPGSSPDGYVLFGWLTTYDWYFPLFVPVSIFHIFPRTCVLRELYVYISVILTFYFFKVIRADALPCCVEICEWTSVLRTWI